MCYCYSLKYDKALKCFLKSKELNYEEDIYYYISFCKRCLLIDNEQYEYKQNKPTISPYYLMMYNMLLLD